MNDKLLYYTNTHTTPKKKKKISLTSPRVAYCCCHPITASAPAHPRTIRNPHSRRRIFEDQHRNHRRSKPLYFLYSTHRGGSHSSVKFATLSRRSWTHRIYNNFSLGGTPNLQCWARKRERKIFKQFLGKIVSLLRKSDFKLFYKMCWRQ